ncbi:transporter [Pseudaminobacter sp. 19-2017]|uniref:Transporter n=1 Tax=Pseudaminobacter soli (ex Zhang et al. 2022) TaxID=2831468 RepID=A0A942DWZ5_9HYPH|nr:transporter [Pseudaminobacter soli]MBS3648673.1 transporter [Pseudaminobacter soli]
MPSGAEIQKNLTGAWGMMMGKADGLRLLDLSADGFWNSFFAIVVALPALALSWISVADDLTLNLVGVTKFSVIARLAVVDVGTWVLPLVGLALAARPAGIADRFVHYVVASNWGSAILLWLMLPAALVRLLAPSAHQLAALVTLLSYGLTLVLAWRLTNVAIGRGAALATSVFGGMFVASLLVLYLLQHLVGLSPS